MRFNDVFIVNISEKNFGWESIEEVNLSKYQTKIDFFQVYFLTFLFLHFSYFLIIFRLCCFMYMKKKKKFCNKIFITKTENMVCHVLFIVLKKQRKKKKVKVLFTFRILFVKIHVVLTYRLWYSKHNIRYWVLAERNIIYTYIGNGRCTNNLLFFFYLFIFQYNPRCIQLVHCCLQNINKILTRSNFVNFTRT